MNRLALSVAFGLMASVANANDFEPQMRAYLENEIASWVQEDAIVAAIRAQNDTTSHYDQARIDSLDKEWRAAVADPSAPIITAVLNSDVSNHLREIVQNAGGAIAEIIVMDAKGLNVAVSAVTSDYWQGDEAKHAKTYGMGAGSVLIDEVELDESTQMYVGQVSITVVDPSTGAPIGAVTVGLDAEALM